MYNYLSGHPKKFKLFLVLLTLFVLGSALYLRMSLFSVDTIYYYIFSTIVQGFIALAAFLGAVAIFKIQSLESHLDKLKDRVLVYIGSYFGLTSHTWTATELMNKVREVSDTRTQYIENNPSLKEPIDSICSIMDKVLEEKSAIRNKMVDLTIVSFVNVSLALIALVFVPFFKTHINVGGAVVVVNIFLSILTLFSALRVVRLSVGYSFKRSLGA